MEDYLKIQSLSKIYGQRLVLNGVNLTVHEGEILTLLGPSGSGKSTLLYCVAGLVAPDCGRVTLAGKDLTDLPPNLRDIGMVFQNYSLFPTMSVTQNVAFPLRAQRERGLLGLAKGLLFKGFSTEIRESVEAMLSLVKLNGHGDRKPKQLSGGEQQRVALARALVFDPKLLCMDEPLGSLDKNLRYEMQLEIRALQQRLRKTMLYVTHDQLEAFTLSDRVALIAHGRIAQVGTPSELYDKPVNDFVARFVGDCNTFEVCACERVGDGFGVTIRDGLRILVPSEAQPGRDVIGIRPERLRLGNICSGNAGVIPIVIKSLTYAGGSVRIEALTQGGERIALMAERGGVGSLASGAEAKVTYDRESFMVLPKASEREGATE